MSTPPPVDPKTAFESMVRQYMLANAKGPTSDKVPELEVRFAAHRRSLTRTDYDAAISHLVAAGFASANPNGEHMLRITNMYARDDGAQKSSNVRVEVPGLDLIHTYCKTNTIQSLLDKGANAAADKVKFTRKMFAEDAETGAKIGIVFFNEFDFSASFKTEEDLGTTTKTVQTIVEDWDTAKRTFRLINRVRFAHPDLPVFADLSIIKSSSVAKSTVRGSRDVHIPVHTLQDAGVLKNPESFEIELELDNSKAGYGTDYTTPNDLLAAVRKCIRVVLGALRQTAYPIPNSESAEVLAQYAKLVYGVGNSAGAGAGKSGGARDGPRDKTDASAPATPAAAPRFIGPQPVTLQLKHLVAAPDDAEGTACILRDYTVTEKADGERRLLYISDVGKMYMITPAMHVIFTGMGSGNPACFNSLLDGEFVPIDRGGKAINTFAAFDVYFFGGEDVRSLRLTPPPIAVDEGGTKEPSKKELAAEEACRLRILNHIVSSIRMRLATSPDYVRETAVLLRGPEGGKEKIAASTRAREAPLNFRIKAKKFYAGTDAASIFAGCAAILADAENKVLEYETDGLIFTPADCGVGGVPGTVSGPGIGAKAATARTWEYAFKWKPPEFNTVDFLVRLKKDASGRDEVHSVYQEGVNLAAGAQSRQYKTLVLCCGFNKNDGYMNPFEDVINANYARPADTRADPNSYVAVPFQATHPYDDTAYLCHLALRAVPGAPGAPMALMTEADEPFGENTIVEFRYEMSAEYGWRWRPIRVRHDKTAEMLAGARQFGNAYKVANDNWCSIHFAITRDIICGREDVSGLNTGAIGEVYYNTNVRSALAMGLRDFHNRYVKNKLLLRVCNRGDTLIDYAVGRAGDLWKWKEARLRFVLGIDVARDGIEGKFDGACKRYLDVRANLRPGADFPAALFVTGTMGLNIKSGEAFQGTGDRNYKVVQAVFGHGPKDPAVIGKAVYEQYGVAGDESGSGAAGGGGGFNVSSCQFAVHYMFENKMTLHNFARNVAECTRVGGFFVGTCYDGETVFQTLANKPADGSVSVIKDGQTILKITKRYTETGFPATPDGLGLKIDVYQESIGQTLSEYLVHYDYLVSVLSAYGIEPLAREEAQQLGFSRGGTGRFSDMFDEMNAEPAAIRKGYGQASTMSREEQRVSFLNRYFVFRKRFNVDTARVFDIMTRGDGVPPDVDWAAAATANHLAANIKTMGPDAGQAVTIGPDLAAAEPPAPAEPEREVWPAPTATRVRIKRPPGGPPGAPPAAPV